MSDGNRPPNRDPKTNLFIPGGGNGGAMRKQAVARKAARSALHADFVAALQEHFQENGRAAIEIAFRESPVDYLKIIVAVLPKEFVFEDGRLNSMSDEELEQHLEHIRTLRLRLGQDGSDAAGGASAAPDRKQIEILPPLPKAENVS